MTTTLEELAIQAMTLTSGERAAFAQLLLASLDEDPAIDEAWAVEVERRIRDLESGMISAVPMADALARVRASLK